MAFSSEVREKVLQIAKKVRPASKSIEIKGRFWFDQHCGQRMVKVRTYSGNSCGDHNEYFRAPHDFRDLGICSCPNCDYYFVYNPYPE